MIDCQADGPLFNKEEPVQRTYSTLLETVRLPSVSLVSHAFILYEITNSHVYIACLQSKPQPLCWKSVGSTWACPFLQEWQTNTGGWTGSHSSVWARSTRRKCQAHVALYGSSTCHQPSSVKWNYLCVLFLQSSSSINDTKQESAAEKAVWQRWFGKLLLRAASLTLLLNPEMHFPNNIS